MAEALPWERALAMTYTVSSSDRSQFLHQRDFEIVTGKGEANQISLSEVNAMLNR